MFKFIIRMSFMLYVTRIKPRSIIFFFLYHQKWFC